MERKKFEETPKEIFCPIRDIISRLSDKWSLLVIYRLSLQDKMRFNEIQKELEDISQRMLTVTLRTLEADGLVNRKVYPEVPPRVEYQLTGLGRSLLPPLHELLTWAKENTNSIKESRRNYYSKE